nr:ATP-binding protein [Spirosoma foliorum]
MIPGKGTLKQSHKTKPVKGVSTLKAAVILGANASGKSNIIKALDFGKILLLSGVKSEQPIKYQPFRLNSKSVNSNSRIEYEFQHKGKNYAYGFVFNSREIVEEWLFELTSKSESKIFERNIKLRSIYDLEPLLKKSKKDEQRQFLNFIAKSTPNNQLFLTEIRTRRVKENVGDISDLLNVIDWFQNSLKIVFPDDKYKEGIKSELKDDSKLQITFEELLKYFDTGISGICLEKVEFDSIELPTEILDKIKEDLLDQKTENIRLILPLKSSTYFISKTKNKNLSVQKFMTKHNVAGQKKPELFDTRDESDGTNRIIDLIPFIIDLLQGDNVFIIDEMERSLHPNLIYDLFDLFLDKSENINSQLIVASHESTLLTQKLLRKDEIWFVTKDEEGNSRLHSLEEYNIRFDKEIRKDYLLGRYKAVPRIGNRNKLTSLPNQDN